MKRSMLASLTLSVLVTGCSLAGLAGSSTEAGDAAQGAGNGATTRDGASEGDTGRRDASAGGDGASPVDATGDVGGEFSGSCGSSPVFVDDFSATAAPGAGYTTVDGSWARAQGTYTVTYPGGIPGQRAYSLIDGDFGDFDVTVTGHSIGGDGFGLVYATSGVGDGYAVLIHPNEFHGLYLKGLVPGGDDLNVAGATLPMLDASSPFSLRVVRSAGHVSITLSGAALASPVTVSGDESVTGASAAHGRLGLILSLTSDLEGAVFTDLDVATASCGSSSPIDAGKDSGNTGDGGGAPSGPVPMMPEYSSYVLAPGGDFEFAQMASSTAVLPPGWELAPESQIGSPSLLSNVAIENGTGLVLTVSDSSGSGACIYTKSGFSLKAPYYREVEAIMPTSGGEVVNHSCSWALTTDPPDDVSIAGEIDIDEGGWLVDSGTLHNGPESALYTYGPQMGVPVGSHKYGVYVTSTEVTWYEDGESLGTFAFPEAVPADAAWYPIETNQGADGVEGATSPTVTGSAGEYVVAYDRWFVTP